jgi:predicted RNA binding protein YcfA (HicA-like mRNA interferase family)
MSKREKFLAQLLNPAAATNLDFTSLVNLLLFLGFEQRVRGSHHIFTRAEVVEIINLQPAAGNTVKPYQAKQVRELIMRYQLAVGLSDQL